ncbi:LexA family transcriptional regulator [Persicitalea jodogahamensis]|uniref:HTH cro/C1-type domain-containing protein n=1 Tax=Persicitalea jodogahamensis TaxID=402147 RepID=A0A8J3D2X8_9BACT|nr:XRE family transcriptional regulator [Persicitalea jodogahamensis]GHB63896.1 hypothetical protein GCM10007390_17170 [Persicitalea jodogahamensis]
MAHSVELSAQELKKFRKEFNLRQEDLGEELGVHKNTISNWEKGKGIPDTKMQQLLTYINNLRNPSKNEVANSIHPHKIRYPDDVELIELPFVSVPARAGFVDLPDGVTGTTIETYPVIKTKNVNYEGQILIEVNGDSMEPNYPSGTIVRCKQVDPNNWAYLKSGVYAVVFGNSFVIKRVKDNNFQEGFLTLHSDNTDTGGKMDVRIKDIRQIWRVEWIEGAPAR